MDNLTVGNPIAHRVRIYYTGSDTLVEGEPLCYSFKTTRNWFGGSVSDEGVVTASEYVAEGSHNASKYICVESPMQASITSMDSADGSNVITGDGTDFANLQVGMAVSIASATDDAFDGNYVITAVGALGITITLDMTAAEAAAVTTQTDVTVQIDNIPAFAGVVAKGGWCGREGPRVLDIYVPNGAVVPVRNDQNCTLGRTILAVHSNEQHLTAPHASNAYPVAIAWETVDTGTTTGLCLAKLDPNIFIHQMGDNGGLIVDDEDTTSSIAINKMDITFNGSATYHRALYYIANLDGGGAGLNGVFKFRTYVNSTMTSWVQVVCGNLHLKDDGVLKSGISELNSCFYATIETEETSSPAVLTGQYMCAYQAAYYLDESETSPTFAAVIGVPAGFGAGTYEWDGLIMTGRGHLGDHAAEDGGLNTTTAGDRMIPCRFNDTTYYIVAYADDDVS